MSAPINSTEEAILKIWNLTPDMGSTGDMLIGASLLAREFGSLRFAEDLEFCAIWARAKHLASINNPDPLAQFNTLADKTIADLALAKLSPPHALIYLEDAHSRIQQMLEQASQQIPEAARA